MHVITRKRLNEFAEKYPESKNALADWYSLAKRNNFSKFAQLKVMFPSADQVGRFTVLSQYLTV
jgi:mRNA interferase HigB